MRDDRSQPILPLAVAFLLAFAGLTRGAHDLWSATVVHLGVLALFVSTAVVAYRRGEAMRFPAVTGLAVLLAVWAWSAVNAGNRFDAIFATKDLAAAILMFYLGSNLFEDERYLRLLLAGAAVLLVIQALMAVSQWVIVRSSPDGEAPGALINANVQAAFALFWIPGFIAEWRRDRATRLAFVWLSGLGAILLILFATESVAAVLCVVLAGFFWAARSSRTAAGRTGWIAAALLCGAAVVWYKLTRNYGPGGWWIPARTEMDRCDWWKTGWQMFRNRPWFGIGPGGYPSAFPAFKVGAGQSSRFAHSFPVTLLAETGVAGLTAAALFAAQWVRSCSADRSGSRRPFLIGAALFLAVTSVGLGGEYLINQLTLALFLGILVGNAPSLAWKPRLAHVVILAALALLPVPWLVSPLLASRLVVAAREDVAANRRDAALVHSTSAVDLDPSMPDAWEVRAAALWSVGSVDAAIDAIDTASHLNRYDANLVIQKAKMLAGAGRQAEAEKEAERAYLLNPRLFPAAKP